MGGERERKPGASTQVANDYSQIANTPGKQTLAGNSRHLSGTGVCDVAQGSPRCGLEPFVRDRIVSAYQREVRITESFYTQALGEIGFERMIQKAEEFPAIAVLMLDMVTDHLGGELVKFLLSMRSAPTAKIFKSMEGMLDFQSGGASGERDPSFVRDLINNANPHGLGLAVKNIGAKAKKTITAVASDSKATELDYIDQLKVSASVIFQSLDQDLPGEMDDGQLIAAFNAFRAEMGQNIPALKALLKEKIQRYMETAAKIGRTDEKEGHRIITRDTQVVWVNIAGDPTPRLYYAKVDYDWHPNSPHAARDQTFKLTRPVEPEFVNTALERHVQQWKIPVMSRSLSRTELVTETNDYSLLMELPSVSLSS